MYTAQPEQSAAKSRPQHLSPELNEFLHMLTALEQQTVLPASLPPSRR